VTYFADTSALIKRYLQEAGSSYVRKLAASAGTVFYQSFVTPLEIASALYRHQRAGDLSSEELSFLLKSYAVHSHEEYLLVSHSESLIEAAEVLISRHPLRTLDAIQLAAALKLRDYLPSDASPLIFLAGDERLVTASLQEHLQAENPEKRS
jgi:predicted nucleic acid-binding protein